MADGAEREGEDAGDEVIQPSLYPEPATVASPLCWKEPACRPRGRAVEGPARDLGGCVNTAVACQDCKAVGELSVRKLS